MAFGPKKFQQRNEGEKSVVMSLGGLWPNETSGNPGGIFKLADLIEKLEEAGSGCDSVRLTVIENQWKRGPRDAEYKLLVAPVQTRLRPNGVEPAGGFQPKPAAATLRGGRKPPKKFGEPAIPDEVEDEANNEEEEIS